MQKKITVYINGRFLERPTTGVERVAKELLYALEQKIAQDPDCLMLKDGRMLQFKLIGRALPEPIQRQFSHFNYRCNRFLSGHFWEQITLLAYVRTGWLLDLCNTGPLFKRNRLVFLHDAAIFSLPKSFSWKFRVWYYILFHLGGRCAKSILASTDFSKQELVEKVGLNPSKMASITFGCDHVLNTPVDSSILERYGLHQKKYILAVSSANPNKNFLAIANAFYQLKRTHSDIQFVIVGRTQQKHFSIDYELDKLGIHVGHVTDSELFGLYQGALCLVYPSFYEGFGLPPIEAMAYGCPVIVSKTASLPEVCSNAALYCDPHHYESIIDAIDRLIREPNLWSEMRQKGLEHSQKWRWVQGAEDLLNQIKNSITGI